MKKKLLALLEAAFLTVNAAAGQFELIASAANETAVTESSVTEVSELTETEVRVTDIIELTDTETETITEIETDIEIETATETDIETETQTETETETAIEDDNGEEPVIVSANRNLKKKAIALTEREISLKPDTGLVNSAAPLKTDVKEKQAAEKKLVSKSNEKKAAQKKIDEPQIYMQGILPEDVSAAVVSVEPEECIEPTEDTILYAYDISLYSQDTVYEPDGEQIQVTISGEEIARAVEEGRLLTVVHIPDDPSLPVEYIQDVTYSGDTLTFSAAAFSVYLIKDGTSDVVTTNRNVYHYLAGEKSNGKLRNTPYEFAAVSEDGIAKQVTQQIVRNGDILIEPPVPPVDSDNQDFIGWYIIAEKTGTYTGDFDWPAPDGIDDKRVTFNTPVTVSKDNVHYYLAPLYQEYRIVQFLDSSGATITKKLAVLGDTVDNMEADVVISDVTAPDLSNNEIFYGWTYTDSSGKTINKSVFNDEGELVDTKITVSKAYTDRVIQLTPLYKTAYWLNFNSMDNDASYIAPILVEAQYNAEDEIMECSVTNDILSSKIPVRSGYTFDGWYLDEGYTIQLTDGKGKLVDPYTGGYGLGGNTAIYAAWKYNGDPVQYNYIYWEQLSSDTIGGEKHYSFLRSEPKTGMPGLKTDPPKNVAQQVGFTVTIQEPQIIQSDGSTVVNIYYDRNIATIDFMTYTKDYTYTATTGYNGNTQYYGYVDGEYVTIKRVSQGVKWTYTVPKYVVYKAPDPTSGWIIIQHDTNPYRVYVVEDGAMVKKTLYAHRNQWFTNAFRNTTYKGTVYQQDGTQPYTGTRYSKSGSKYSTTSSNMKSGLYGKVDGYYVPLTGTSTEEFKWYYTQNGVDIEYPGTRYTRSTSRKEEWHLYKSISGLYGQTFEQARVTDSTVFWPTEYDWYDSYSSNGKGSGTRTTFLDGFLEAAFAPDGKFNSEIKYYGSNQGGNSGTVEFLQQNLTSEANFNENDYTVANSVIVNSNSFTLTNKYQGFALYAWRTWKNNNTAVWDTINLNVKEKAAIRNTLQIFFKRNSYKLIFLDGDNDMSKPLKTYTVLYGDDLTKYANEPLPKNTVDIEYTKWSTDLTGMTMPANNVVVYAEQKRPVYNLTYELEGGAFENDDFRTFYTLRYPYYKANEYDLVEREYVPDANGSYVYICVTPENAGDDDVEHIAKYVPANSQDASDYADYLVMNGTNPQRYRPMKEVDGSYELLGWYEVDPETGEVSDVPFNFHADIERDTTLRAVWQNTGARFTVLYDVVDKNNIGGTLSEATEQKNFMENAKFTVAGRPQNITNGYVFEHWEVYWGDKDNPQTQRVMPGDQLLVSRDIADSDLKIHIRAVYAVDDESEHNQQLVHLKLHANFIDKANGKTVEDIELIKNLQQNQRVDLSEYKTTFKRENYKLLGWSADPNATEPDYSLTAQVGAYLDKPGKLQDAESFTQHLYAVWQPLPLPTGISSTTAPFTIMVCMAALIFAVYIYQKKKGVMSDGSSPI